MPLPPGLDLLKLLLESLEDGDLKEPGASSGWERVAWGDSYSLEIRLGLFDTSVCTYLIVFLCIYFFEVNLFIQLVAHSSACDLWLGRVQNFDWFCAGGLDLD